MIRIITWLWRQEKSLNEYIASDVNTWASMLSRHVTIPHKLACVTDIPDGIDSKIEIIPIPDAPDCRSEHWPESKGLPQCYRRLHLWSREAKSVYGERFVCLDLDLVVTGNLDALLSRQDEILIARGTRQRAPYNGSFLLMDAGVNPDVWERAPEVAKEASELFIGSDQAVIRFLCPLLPTVGEESGLYTYSPSRFPAPLKLRHNLSKARKAMPHAEHLKPGGPRLPENMKLLFFTGRKKPRDIVSSHPLLSEHYR